MDEERDYENKEPNVLALNFEKRAFKEQGYIEGFVHDIGIKMLIDTGAKITLISKEMFDKIAEKPLLSECDSKLYTANGTSLTVLGQAAFNIKLNDHTFVHTVLVIEGFLMNSCWERTF